MPRTDQLNIFFCDDHFVKIVRVLGINLNSIG